MANKTRSQLKAGAVLIRDETGEGLNTAPRVGGQHVDEVSSGLFEYDPNDTYQPGEYCIYQGGLAKAKTVIGQGESPDSAAIKWDWRVAKTSGDIALGNYKPVSANAIAELLATPGSPGADVPNATTSIKGKVRLATDAEYDAGVASDIVPSVKQVHSQLAEVGALLSELEIGTLDGVPIDLTNPVAGQQIVLTVGNDGKLIVSNQTPTTPTPDQVARQEYTQNTNDSDGVFVPVLENGIYRLPRVMGWTRAGQYILTFLTPELLSGLSFQIRPYLQSLADRGAYFDKLALTGFQYADAGSRQLDTVLAEENGQFVIRALTPAESGQRILSQLPPAQLAAIVAPYLSGGDQSLRKVVKRCEVLVPVPAPTSQKIMLSGASDGQVIPHDLETDQIEFDGAYSLNGANVYQLDTTVAITDPTATNVKLLTANPFTGYIRLRNATV